MTFLSGDGMFSLCLWEFGFSSFLPHVHSCLCTVPTISDSPGCDRLYWLTTRTSRTSTSEFPQNSLLHHNDWISIWKAELLWAALSFMMQGAKLDIHPRTVYPTAHQQQLMFSTHTTFSLHWAVDHHPATVQPWTCWTHGHSCKHTKPLWSVQASIL